MGDLNSSQVWAPLVFFESPEYAGACYRKFHGGDANATKLAEIGSAFRQARLFHQSFGAADFIIQPVALYYCVLALSRALILFLERSKREANLAQRHGLTCLDWSEFLNQTGSNVAGLCVRIENGTFLELLSATRNINLVRANSNRVNFQIMGPMPANGTTAELQMLCAGIPDLAGDYEKWTGERIIAAKLLSLTPGEQITLKLENVRSITGCDSLSGDYLRLIFPNAVSIDANTLTVTLLQTDLPLVTSIIETAPFQIGDAVVLPRRNDLFISELGTLFMISFILGMLSRYYPSHWIGLQTIGPRGHFYPFCRRVLDYIGYSFPRAVADVLANLERLG